MSEASIVGTINWGGNRPASVPDAEITGLFSVHPDGFLASAPDREDRPVSISGSFAARRSN